MALYCLLDLGTNKHSLKQSKGFLVNPEFAASGQDFQGGADAIRPQLG